ncbi:hypothetical protein EON66_03815 [archaeon]|nr:MAG: hypothetical protein EON66_03815 [archaeon]
MCGHCADEAMTVATRRKRRRAGEEGEDAPKETARECIAQLRMLTEPSQPASVLLQQAQDANLALAQCADRDTLLDGVAPFQLAAWDSLLASVARACTDACAAVGRNKLLIADALKALTQWLERADVCTSLFGCVPHLFNCRTCAQQAYPNAHATRCVRDRHALRTCTRVPLFGATDCSGSCAAVCQRHGGATLRVHAYRVAKFISSACFKTCSVCNRAPMLRHADSLCEAVPSSTIRRGGSDVAVSSQ